MFAIDVVIWRKRKSNGGSVGAEIDPYDGSERWWSIIWVMTSSSFTYSVLIYVNKSAHLCA